MIDPTLFALYLLAAGAMILSPGPDTIYVLTRSLGDGRGAGIASAAGISLGVLIHTAAAVLGLAALLQASPVAFQAVAYLGAVYLIYLGIRTLRDDGLGSDSIDKDAATADAVGDDTATTDTNSSDGASRTTDSSSRPSAQPDGTSPFTEAVAVNVLNPQVAIFFLAFLPQFVSGAWIELQLTVLGAVYATLTMSYLTVVAVAGSALRRILAARPLVADGLQWATGLILIGLGLRLFVGVL